MKRIIIWYNANRKSIWKVIGIIVVAFATIQFVQYIWIQKQIEQKKTNIPNIDTIDSIQAQLNSITLEEERATVSGEKITSGKVNALEVIDTFANYCNNQKVNEAYSLLSEECKNEMYPKIENFRDGYYNIIFLGKKKNISVENWTKNIYKVKYMDDALSSGIYEQENTIQDYITIITDEAGELKLNINNYIGKEKIEKETEVYDIKVKLLEKDTYMDYTTCTFEITNNSENTILLNDSNQPDGMYLEDANGVKYTAYTHELAEAELRLSPKKVKRIKIKYYSKYVSNKTIKNIVFNRVIIENKLDTSNQNLGTYRDYRAIQITL